MKTKLLKIIRKRYVVNEISALAKNSSDYYQELAEKFSFPFYELVDCGDSYQTSRYFQTFKEAKKRIWEWVLIDYGHRFEAKREKITKVWYK